MPQTEECIDREISEEEDPCDHFCDEYTTNHEKYPGRGYCYQYNEPTSKKLRERCQANVLAEVGPFCFFECPFCDDLEGYLCEDAGAPDIFSCPEYLNALNRALGGADEWEYEYVFENHHKYRPGDHL